MEGVFVNSTSKLYCYRVNWRIIFPCAIKPFYVNLIQCHQSVSLCNSTWAALGVIPYDWVRCAQFTDSYLWFNIGYLTTSIATRGHQMNSETGQNHWFASEYSTHLEPVTLDTMLVCMHLTARKCLYSWLIACLHLHHSKNLAIYGYLHLDMLL